MKKITMTGIANTATAVKQMAVASIAVGVAVLIYGFLDPFSVKPPRHYVYGISLSMSMSHVIDKVRTADEGDTVTLYVNSPGGSVLVLYQLMDAIQESKATVVINVDGFAFSAAAILSFAGDDVLISDNNLFMFHMVRLMRPDQPVEILPLNDPIQKHFVSLLDKYVGKYLTNAEVKAILAGKDVFISGKEMKERIKNPRAFSNVQRIYIDMAQQERIRERLKETEPKDPKVPEPVVPRHVKPAK